MLLRIQIDYLIFCCFFTILKLLLNRIVLLHQTQLCLSHCNLKFIKISLNFSSFLKLTLRWCSSCSLILTTGKLSHCRTTTFKNRSPQNLIPWCIFWCNWKYSCIFKFSMGLKKLILFTFKIDFIFKRRYVRRHSNHRTVFPVSCMSNSLAVYLTLGNTLNRKFVHWSTHYLNSLILVCYSQLRQAAFKFLLQTWVIPACLTSLSSTHH